MKTLVLDAPGEALQMREVALPGVVAGAVRVRCHLVGINYGETLINRIPGFARILFRVGMLFGAKTLPGPHVMTFPYVPGFEVVGVVDETDDPDFPVGTRLLAFPESGGYAEYVAVPTERVVRIPDAVSFEDALGIGLQGITAYEVLHRAAKLQAGESVLITAAAGGVGLQAVQLALLIGASPVVGATSRAEKMALIEKLGAVAVNYAQPDWVQQVRRLTADRGMDVVLDSAGGKKFHQALQATRDGGRLVSYGMADIEAGLQKVSVMGLKMKGLTLTAYKDNWLEQTTQETWSRLMELFQQGQLKPIIRQRYAFQEAEVNRAWQDYRQRVTYGKSIIVVNEEG